MNREVVWNKFAGRCAYCGREIELKDMQVDHMVPKRCGGGDDFWNLMPACRTCNHYKRAETVESFREAISRIPQKLGEREYIYKVGMAYGFYDDKPRPVKFWFERYADLWVN